jgi:ribosomal RNA assembly protein
MQYVKIPEERVRVLIGKEGGTKRDLESRSKTKISIEETTVTIEGEPLAEWRMKDVVHSIGRGFNPEKARLLLSDDYVLEIIELGEVANSPNSMKRLKGRIIGEKGRSRRFLEKTTNTMLSVYGRTVSIIGSYENVELAREAVSMLLSGSKHSTVYRHLEKKTKQRKARV